MLRRLFASLALCWILFPPDIAPGAERELPPPADRQVDFTTDIQPIFARYCYSCHGADEQQSSYRLDNGKIGLQGGDLGERPIVAGKSADSPLVRYIGGVDETLVMPPKGPRPTAQEISLVRAWIDQGASWPEQTNARPKLTTNHWSYQPLLFPPVPTTGQQPMLSSPIDAFIVQRLAEKQLSLARPAAKATLIRRLYLDVLGLPPTPEEIAEFTSDPAADAYERLVDRVLASPRYGERWARHWLDVVRFAESNGFETNVERPSAWRYRDYVIDAFNRDLPYDQFVFQQLAGDTVGADVATSFLVGGPNDQVKSPDPVLTAMQRSDELADMTNTTATTFLGVTIGCARCHNHKFDPILQTDYYALQAVFAGVQHGERPIPRQLTSDEEQLLATGKQRLEVLTRQLAGLQPVARPGNVLLLDDEQPWQSGSNIAGTELLATKEGHGINPEGTARGEKNDPGDVDRLPNVSRGRYTWWKPAENLDVFAYHPQVRGKHRLWLSWGCGWQTHTTDAQYVLDLDGNRETVDDQTVIFTANQQQFADRSGKIVSRPLWSGFADAGVHDFRPESVLLLRGGKTGEAITADAIVLEPVVNADEFAARPLQPALRPAANARENVEQFPAREARFIRFTALKTNSGEPCLDELEVYAVPQDGHLPRNVARGTEVKLTSSGNYAGNPFHRLEHINDGRYGNSFSWISNTNGIGWVQLELPEPAVIDRIVWGRDRDEKYQDRTALRYRIEVATTPNAWQVVASSEDRIPFADSASGKSSTLIGLSAPDVEQAKSWLAEQKELNQRLQSLQSTAVAYAGRFISPPPTHRLFRGDPMLPRELVAPDCLTVLGSLSLAAETAERDRRVALANWIASATNPLTPRVIANRLWQHHFGTGIVDTPSDFGVNGGQPSHPQLLDWLASRLIADDWSTKNLHREILCSQTYRQASEPNAAAIAADAQCRLLWRYPSRRMEAEAIRDSILAVSGNLDLSMHGPGWSTFEPNSNYVRVYNPREQFGPAEWRRTVYMQKIRMRQDGVFGVFDCPDGGQIAPKRSRSTTALQALSLFNSPFILQQSELLAQRVSADTGNDQALQASRALELVLGRTARADEVEAAKALVAEHGLPALCRALLNANEFLFIP